MPKISELTEATSVSPTDEVAIVQSGATKRVDASELVTYARSSGDAGSPATAIVDWSYEPGNVLRYKANSSPGTTDMTTAFAAAIDAHPALVKVPAGSYLISSTITIPSECFIEFEAGAKLLPSGNSLTFFQTVTGSPSSTATGVVVRNPTFDGNGKSGITCFDFTSLQIASEIIGMNIFRCDTGVVFTSGCVGVRIINPTCYRVPNPVKCLTGTNGVTIIGPNFDNTTDHGGTGAGNGVYVNVSTYSDASTTKIYGGFIQGFEYGVQDKGFATGVHGLYFERCSAAAIYLNGSKSAHLTDNYHFGFGDTCTIKGRNADGAVLVGNRMAKSTASAGLYDFDNTNVGSLARGSWLWPMRSSPRTMSTVAQALCPGCRPARKAAKCSSWSIATPSRTFTSRLTNRSLKEIRS